MKNKLLILLLMAGPLFAAGQTDSSAFYLQKGVEEEQGRQWQAAFRCFQRATELRPGNADAQVALARAATQLKKYDVAAAAFQKGLALKKQELGAGAAFSTFTVDSRDFEEIFTYAAKAGVLKSDGTTKYIQGKVHTITTSDTTASDATASTENQASAKNTASTENTATENTADDATSASGAKATATSDPGAAVSASSGSAVRPETPPDAEIAYRIGKVFLKKQNYRAAAPFLEQAALLDSTKADRTYECALNFSAIPDPLTAIKYYLLAEKRGYKTDAVFYRNLSNAYLAAGQTTAYEKIKQKLADADSE